MTETTGISETTELVELRLDIDVIEYFQKMEAAFGQPYEKLIALYLAEWVENDKSR